MRNLFFMLLVILLGSCDYSIRNTVRGNGQPGSQVRSASNFTGVEVSGPIKVFITQGDTWAVEVRADENIIEYIETEVKNGELVVHTKRGSSFRPKMPIEVFVTAPAFETLDVTGAGNMIAKTRITGQRISLEVTGSGDLVAEVDAPNILTEITGSGNIILKGRARDLDAEITGSGELRAFELLTENSNIEISGSGDAELFASKKIDVDIAGAGNISYKGNAVLTKSVSGAGSISKIN